MRMGWRLWLSAIVCLVAIASAFHVFLLDRVGVPDNGLRVSEVTREDGGLDWTIRLYDSVEKGKVRRRWQAAGEGYRIDVQRRGEHGLALDIAYRTEAQTRHRVTVRFR